MLDSTPRRQQQMRACRSGQITQRPDAGMEQPDAGMVQRDASAQESDVGMASALAVRYRLMQV